MGDEQYYLIVEEELKADKIDKALWAKASTLSKGDEQGTRSRYIQMRVEILKEEAIQIQKEATKENLIVQTKKWSIIAGKVIGGIAAVIVIFFSYQAYQRYMDELIDHQGFKCETNEGSLTYLITRGERRNAGLGLLEIEKIMISHFYEGKFYVWKDLWPKFSKDEREYFSYKKLWEQQDDESYDFMLTKKIPTKFMKKTEGKWDYRYFSLLIQVEQLEEKKINQLHYSKNKRGIEQLCFSRSPVSIYEEIKKE